MKRLFLYLALTAALVVGLNMYVAADPMFSSKARRVDLNYEMLASKADHCSGDEQSLVLGNSYVGHSFLAQDSDCAFSKFVVFGMPLGDAVNIIRNLPASTDFKYVVFGLGYDQANPVRNDSTVYRSHWSGNPVERWFWAIPIMRGRGLVLDLVREDVKCLIGRNECEREEIEMPSRTARVAEFQDSIRSRYREYQPYVSSVSPTLREGLVELRNVAADHNVGLLVYTAPIAPELRQLLGNDFVREFHEAIRTTGVHYVDMNDITSEWDSSYFSDATHVSPKGGSIVTEKVRELVAQN
jgi:hypothetical protein